MTWRRRERYKVFCIQTNIAVRLEKRRPDFPRDISVPLRNSQSKAIDLVLSKPNQPPCRLNEHDNNSKPKTPHLPTIVTMAETVRILQIRMAQSAEPRGAARRASKPSWPPNGIEEGPTTRRKRCVYIVS